MVGAATGVGSGVVPGSAVGSGAGAGAVGSGAGSVGGGSEGCDVGVGSGDAVGSSAKARAGRTSVAMSSSAWSTAAKRKARASIDMPPPRPRTELHHAWPGGSEKRDENDRGSRTRRVTAILNWARTLLQCYRKGSTFDDTWVRARTTCSWALLRRPPKAHPDPTNRWSRRRGAASDRTRP